MSLTKPKEAALKILITTANKHNLSPENAIEKTLAACDNIIKIHKESGQSIPGYVRYQTNYWKKVKQWLNRKDLTAF